MFQFVASGHAKIRIQAFLTGKCLEVYSPGIHDLFVLKIKII